MKSSFVPTLLLADTLILIGMSRLLFFSHFSPERNLFWVFIALAILNLTLLAIISIQALGRRKGYPHLAWVVILILAASVVWALPTLVTPFKPTAQSLQNSLVSPTMTITMGAPHYNQRPLLENLSGSVSRDDEKGSGNHPGKVAGVITSTPGLNAEIDTTVPSLSMTPKGILGGGDYYRSAVTVSLAGTDTGSGVASVEYRLDGQDWVQGNEVVISADGDHGLEGRVTDKAGNVTHRGIAVHIDTIPPVATFIMPAPGSTTWVQGMIMLGGKVSDVGSGVAGVEISLDGGMTWHTLKLVNEIWRYDWETTPLIIGEYRVFARAKDIAGNVQSLGSTVIIIAPTHPAPWMCRSDSAIKPSESGLLIVYNLCPCNSGHPFRSNSSCSLPEQSDFTDDKKLS